MSAARLRVCLGVCLCLLLGLIWFPSALRAAAPIPWDRNAQGYFVTCLCADLTGHFWMGTEDHGVWRYDPEAPPGRQYLHFTSKNGLADDSAYAMVCDKHGRVWVGTLNHGVSVYSGSQWRNFSPPDGPLGSRVFALAASPVDGDVWIATECGLTRFSLQKQTWIDYTGQNGLPPGGPTALAFAQDGTLYVGMPCDGLVVGAAKDGYKTWRCIPGPAQMPVTATGSGLPSGMVNCLLAAQDGAIYVGTTCGLAVTRDGGATWKFTRGADWRDKVLGLRNGPKPADADPKLPVLAEDYVTALAEDAAGKLIIGHRESGLELWDPKAQARVALKDNDPNTDDVDCLLPWPGGACLVGGYGWGLTQIASPPPASPVAAQVTLPDVRGVPPLPAPSAPPNLAQLNALTAQVCSVQANPHETEPSVAALPDDWITEGDWLGRYGRYWAALAAFFHPIPADYLWGAGWQPVDYAVAMGPNHGGGDSLRYWLQWRYTDNPHVLEMPAAYTSSRVVKHYTTWDQNRREAEWDDHGETYPTSMEGPNVYATVTVPDGLYYLSLYDFNKDGHDERDRFRDYRLSVRVHSGLSLEDVGGFDTQPELAHGRIKDFWGGVWKRFLVRGPQAVTVELSRNNSHNVILPAVMLDLVDEDPAPYFQNEDQWNARESARDRKRTALTRRPEVYRPAHSEGEAANHLFDLLNEKRLSNSAWWATEGRRYYAPLLRWYAAVLQTPSSESRARLYLHLATCEYQLGQYPLWEKWQAAAGLTTARQIERSLRWDGVTNSYCGLGYQIVSVRQSEATGRKVSQSR